jgi:murein DD-endopeptidase MepM/ murein hydrolase activator NlpD
MITPVQGPVIQDYSQIHHGVDIACVTGTPVVATMDGYGFFRYDGDMGWQFIQTSREGARVVLSHLAGAGLNTWYTKGQQISTCASTGRLSSGPHVHVDGSDPPVIRAVFGL